MLVRDVMALNRRDVVTVRAGAAIDEAARLLAARDVGVLAVVDGDGRSLGLVSERDIARTCARGIADIPNLRVTDIMTAPIECCRPGDAIEAVRQCMVDRHTRHLPVIEDGKMAGMISLRDIARAERRRIDAVNDTLAETERKFRNAIDNAPNGIYVQIGGVVVYANRAAASLLGAADPRELIGLQSIGLYHPDCRDEVRRRRSAADRHKPLDGVFEPAIVRRDGLLFDAETVSQEVIWDGEPAILVHFRDCTAQKKAERGLRESEARHRGIIDLAADAIISVDAGGRITHFNRAASAIFGYAVAEVVDQSLDMLLPERFRAAHDRHLAGFIDSPEATRRMDRRGTIVGLRKDGTEFPAEASISRCELADGPVLTVMLRDIAERQQADEALRAAKTRAEIADRSKSEFLANMSHELRTPLNAIIGFSEILAMQTPGSVRDIKYRDYARDILQSGRHLLSLVNDILDLSRLDSADLRLDEEIVDIGELIRSCILNNRERAGDAGIDIVEEITDDRNLMLRADPRRLRQILTNLISNAVKFTGPEGTVTVRSWLKPRDGYVLQVIDTGIGIASEDIPKALAPFEHLQSTLSRKHDGSGLGLFLAKLLVERHGGSLDLQSRLGEGTTVTVRLPTTRIVSSAA